MANEEEMESFEISEQDMYDALQPGQRRSHRPSKNQQIYGVFNYEDEEAPSFSQPHNAFGKSKKSGSKGGDYTAPVGFVKGGVQQAGKKKEEAKESSKPKLVDVSERYRTAAVERTLFYLSLTDFSDDEDGDGATMSVEDRMLLKSLSKKSKNKCK